MQTQSTTQPLSIPSLEDSLSVATLATFGAFKVDERISFIRNYDPRVQDIPNFRHAVVRYRVTTKTEVVEKPAKMVTIPQIKLGEEYELLDERARKVIVGVYEDEQDNMLRSFIDQGRSNIAWADVAIDKVLDSLTAIRISNRLNKEQIERWARIALVDVCNVRADQISEGKGYVAALKEKQRAATLNDYVNLSMKLAAPVPNVGQHEATALKNLLLVGKLADDLSKVLLSKLDAMLNPKIVSNANL